MYFEDLLKKKKQEIEGMSQQLYFSEKSRKSFEQKISELSIQLSTSQNQQQIQAKKTESALNELKQLSKTESESNERVQQLQNILTQTERRLLTSQKQCNEYQCQVEELKTGYLDFFSQVSSMNSQC